MGWAGRVILPALPTVGRGRKDINMARESWILEMGAPMRESLKMGWPLMGFTIGGMALPLVPTKMRMVPGKTLVSENATLDWKLP